MVPSRSMIAPWGLFWFLRMCFLIICTPSTITRCFLGMTAMILPRLPRSAPAMTTTSSPFFTCNLFITSNHLRRERDNFHEFLLAQFAGDRAENTRAARVVFLVNDDNGVAVEPQIRAIVAPDGLAGADDDRVHHVALFHRAVRRGFLDVRLDHVADDRIALVAADDPDRRRAFRAAVVGHIQNGTYL